MEWGEGQSGGAKLLSTTQEALGAIPELREKGREMAGSVCSVHCFASL